MEKEESLEEMPFLSHLVEFRNRLIICIAAFIFCGAGAYFLVGNQLMALLLAPLHGIHLQVLTLPEAFLIRIKISAWFGLSFALPIILYEIWAFLKPGLYRKEQGYIFLSIFLSTLLFIGGVFFAYRIVLPVSINFFTRFAIPGILVQYRLSDYFSLVIRFLFVFGLIFEVPFFMVLLTRLGLLNPSSVSRQRRFVILGIVITAALLTPPDIFSQIALALPLYTLFEAGLFISFIIRKKSKETS